MTSNMLNDLNALGLGSSSVLQDGGGEDNGAPSETPRPVRVTRPDAEKLPIEIARLLSDSRCTDVLVLDVRGLIDVQDFIVIASGTSERQIRAVSHQVKDLVESHGQGVYRTSADGDARWIVIDCVDVVVHLLEPNERSFRDFESMWGDAPRLEWSRSGDASRPAATRPAAARTPMMSDAGVQQKADSSAAPVGAAPAATKPAKTAKAAAKAAADIGDAPPAKIVKTAKSGKPAKSAKPKRAARGMSKAKMKAKAAAKADGTTAKRRAAAKLVKRAATKAAAKLPGKAKGKVNKKAAKAAGKKAIGAKTAKSAGKPMKKAKASTAKTAKKTAARRK